MNMKIEVKTFKNLKKYANVVYLLDKDNVLKKILKLRASLQKETRVILPLPWEKGTMFYEKIWKPLTKEKQQIIDKAIKKADKKYFDANREGLLTRKEITAYEKAFRLNPAENFDLEVRKIREKFKQYIFMEKIIAKAIIYNEIREEDYIDTYATVLSQEREYPFLPPDPLLCIIFTPTTQYRDILKVFKEDIPKLKNEYRSFGLAPQYPAISRKMKIEIIRDREWYWLWKKYGRKFYSFKTCCPILLKANKICHEELKDADNCLWCKHKKRKYKGVMKETVYDYNSVKNAIKYYQSWLYSQQ